MSLDRTRARRAFDSYVRAYNADNPRIALKIDHTLRVADLARCIAQSESLPDDDCDLAWLLGLLHDIGRFEQLRRWNTFSDARSTSHAMLGVEVLFEQQSGSDPFDEQAETTDHEPGIDIYAGLPVAKRRLRDFIADEVDDDLIRTAVGTHSDFRLPEKQDERTHRFCTILRDADKLDILHTMTGATSSTILGVSEAEFRKSNLSPTAIEAFKEHRCLKRKERIEPADYVVSFLCFAFELVYPESRRIARESGDLFAIAERPFGMEGGFTNSEVSHHFAHMAHELRCYLNA